MLHHFNPTNLCPAIMYHYYRRYCLNIGLVACQPDVGLFWGKRQLFDLCFVFAGNYEHLECWIDIEIKCRPTIGRGYCWHKLQP